MNFQSLLECKFGLTQASGIEVLVTMESMSQTFWYQDMVLTEKFLRGECGWNLVPFVYCH